MAVSSTTYRDLYEFRWLEVGQQKHIVGRDCWQAHKALHCVRRKHRQEMQGRVFRCCNTATGVMITRMENRR